MTQPQEPNGCVGCVWLFIIGFIVFWVGSYAWQYQADKDAPLSWLCWNYSRQDWTRETRDLGGCHYDP